MARFGDRDHQPAPAAQPAADPRAAPPRGSSRCSSACQSTTASSPAGRRLALSTLALTTSTPIRARGLAGRRRRVDARARRGRRRASRRRACRRPRPTSSTRAPAGSAGDEAQPVALGEPRAGARAGGAASPRGGRVGAALVESPRGRRASPIVTAEPQTSQRSSEKARRPASWGSEAVAARQGAAPAGRRPGSASGHAGVRGPASRRRSPRRVTGTVSAMIRRSRASERFSM